MVEQKKKKARVRGLRWTAALALRWLGAGPDPRWEPNVGDDTSCEQSAVYVVYAVYVVDVVYVVCGELHVVSGT